MILLACSARYSDLDRGQFAHTVESFYTASQAPAEGMQDLIPEEPVACHFRHAKDASTAYRGECTHVFISQR